MVKRKSITGIKKRRKPVVAKPRRIRHVSEPASEQFFPEDADSQALEPQRSPEPGPVKQKQRKSRAIPKQTSHTNQNHTLWKPTVRHVSQSVIQSKWKLLDQDAQANVSALFDAVTLPILARYASEKSKKEALDALGLARNMLEKRLPKMPFPLGAGRKHFDHDGLCRETRLLEQQLIETVRALPALGEEVEEERVQLDAEKEELSRTEAQAVEYNSSSESCRHILDFLDLDRIPEQPDMPAAIGLVEAQSS